MSAGIPIEIAAHDIGIKAFVYKPFVRADLAKTVRKVLDENNRSENLYNPIVYS
jgi:FixJ family two-component response regulator